MDIHAAPCPSLPKDSSYEHLLFTSAQPEGCQTYSASSTSRQRLPESHLNFMLGYPGHSALQLTIATQYPTTKDYLDLKYSLKIALSFNFFFPLFSFSFFFFPHFLFWKESVKVCHSLHIVNWLFEYANAFRTKSHERGELKSGVKGPRVSLQWESTFLWGWKSYEHPALLPAGTPETQQARWTPAEMDALI